MVMLVLLVCLVLWASRCRAGLRLGGMTGILLGILGWSVVVKMCPMTWLLSDRHDTMIN